MKFCLITLLVVSLGFNYAIAKISHLLVTTIGDGVVQVVDDDTSEVVSSSSFLPVNRKLSVRPKSGIETLASGYLFRFGSSTIFQCEKDSIRIFSGSLFVRSRNFNNSVSIIGPETTVRLSGAGSCLIEVEKNGGFKCVGLLGKLRLGLRMDDAIALLPGELVFTELKSQTLSDKVTVDLKNLFETSFLISGFSNSNSFENALRSVAESQKLVIGKSFNASVGEATGSDSFEIVTQAVSEKHSTQPLNTSPSNAFHSHYTLPSESPLTELLGRSPKRLDAEGTSPAQRPFPSRLLRGN